eukprot:11622155-Heterocapsa_arctica.AAC.1
MRFFQCIAPTEKHRFPGARSRLLHHAWLEEQLLEPPVGRVVAVREHAFRDVPGLALLAPEASFTVAS